MMVFNSIYYISCGRAACDDLSCDSHHWCDCWLSVYYNGTKQISIFQLV